MPPCRNTMRLVNHDHTDTHMNDVRLPIHIVESLRGNKENFEFTCSCASKRQLIVFFTKIRTHNSRWYGISIVTSLTLIPHQRLERGKDNSEMRIIKACYLVTERLTPSCTLNSQDTLALYKLLNDIALARVKSCGNMKSLN